MKFNLDEKIINVDGKPLQVSEEDDSEVTLGNVLSMACVNADPQKYATGEEKLRIYRILQKVANEDEREVELEAEEITTLKSLVGDSYGVVVVGPVYDILEQRNEEETEEE